MTNLEKIIAASKMGYSAILDDKLQVLAINGDCILVHYGRTVTDQIYDPFQEITGYIYVGHLFGEPVIPEGQRFMVTKGISKGDIMFKSSNEADERGSYYLMDDDEMGDWYELSELEPVFD